MTADTLCNLWKTIKQKRSGLLSEGVILLHDNARAYLAELISSFLANLDLTIFCHPPYSPNFAPLDYHLFPKLIMCLCTQMFLTNEDLMVNVNAGFKNLDESSYAHCVDLLMYRYNKYLNVDSDYVEK